MPRWAIVVTRIFLFLLVVATSCMPGGSQGTGGSSSTGPEPSPAGAILFKNVADEVGVMSQVGAPVTDRGHGVCLLKCGGSKNTHLLLLGGSGSSQFFKGNTDGTFSPIDSVFSQPLMENAAGCLATDLDGNGLTDIVLTGSRVMHFEDQGDCQFIDVSLQSGLAVPFDPADPTADTTTALELYTPNRERPDIFVGRSGSPHRSHWFQFENGAYVDRAEQIGLPMGELVTWGFSWRWGEHSCLFVGVDSPSPTPGDHFYCDSDQGAFVDLAEEVGLARADDTNGICSMGGTISAANDQGQFSIAVSDCGGHPTTIFECQVTPDDPTRPFACVNNHASYLDLSAPTTRWATQSLTSDGTLSATSTWNMILSASGAFLNPQDQNQGREFPSLIKCGDGNACDVYGPAADDALAKRYTGRGLVLLERPGKAGDLLSGDLLFGSDLSGPAYVWQYVGPITGHRIFLEFPTYHGVGIDIKVDVDGINRKRQIHSIGFLGQNGLPGQIVFALGQATKATVTVDCPKQLDRTAWSYTLEVLADEVVSTSCDAPH